MRTILSTLLIASLFLIPCGCKTTGAEKSLKSDPEPGQFSRIRPRDPDSESMGLSSTSRSIERNLGVGE